MKEEGYKLKVELGERNCNALADSILEFKIKGYRYQVAALHKAIIKELERVKE